MITLTQLALFLPAAFLVAMTPGANNLLAFTNGSRAGLVPAAKALTGRMAAFAVMIVLVALGLDVLLRTSELAFQILKWIGVAYLIYLGIRMWRADPEEAIPEARALARREFLTAMGNPKAYLLFTAFLPQFTQGTEAIAVQLLSLGAIYLGVEALAAIIWASGGALLGARALTAARRRWLNRGAGGLLIVAAGGLATAERR